MIIYIQNTNTISIPIKYVSTIYVQYFDIIGVILGSMVVSIPVYHTRDRGSIPHQRD